MMHTMTSSGPGFGFGIFVALHMLAMLAVSFGVLFFVFYVYKTFTHAQLKTWAMWLVIGGIVACIVSAIGMHGMHGGKSMKVRMSMKGGHDMMTEGGMDMSMNGMTMMLDGKTGDDFDAAFLTMMVPHHQGAIDMAEAALTNAKHDEVKNLARDIIKSQQAEIDQMNLWIKDWKYSQ